MEGKQANDAMRVREISKQRLEEVTDAPVAALNSAITEYTEVIKDFFSSAGAGEQIKQMYDKIKPSFEKLPTMNLQDLNYAHHMYSEYLEGMKQFLKGELVQTDGTSDDVMIKKIDDCIDKDDMFIGTLFGNGTNVKTSENITLDEGLTNLEVFIDFIPELNNYKAFADSLKQMIIDGGHDATEASKKLLQLYCKSIIKYSEYLIVSLFDCFQVMSDSLWKKRSYFQKEETPVKTTERKLVLV